MAEHAKLIESAIASFLISQSFPDSLKNEAGLFRIFEGESESDKDGQVIVVSCGSDLTEDPPFSLNYNAECSVELRTPINLPVSGNGETDSLTTHQAAAIVLRAALLDDGFIAGLNSYGGITFYERGTPTFNPSRNESDNYHSSGYTFQTKSVQTN